MKLLREDCIVETYDTGTTWCPCHNGVCVTHVPTGIIERCSDSRNLHANLEKAMAEIQKKIEHIDQGESVVKRVLASLAPHQLARCLAASAIHQIGGGLELKSKEPGDTLLTDLTKDMLKCAEDILETANSDPWMFYVLISTAVSSGVLKLIDRMESNDG